MPDVSETEPDTRTRMVSARRQPDVHSPSPPAACARSTSRLCPDSWCIWSVRTMVTVPSASEADLTRWPSTSKSPPSTLESIRSSSNSTVMVRGSATRALVMDGGTESGVTATATPETASFSL